MTESVQHKLTRVRRPRVQITYDVEVGNAIEKKELPFVVGILADLSGDREDELPILRDRKFVEIDRDNIFEIMSIIHPRVTMRVANKISQEENPEDIAVELKFTHLEDFEPQKIASNAACLSELFAKRNKIRDILAKLDGNDLLETLLDRVMKEKDTREQLAKEITERKG